MDITLTANFGDIGELQFTPFRVRYARYVVFRGVWLYRANSRKSSTASYTTGNKKKSEWRGYEEVAAVKVVYTTF